MITAHGSRSASTATAILFQRNDPHWTLPSSSPENNLPLTRTRSRGLGIQQIPAYSPQPRPHRTRLAHLSGPPGQRTSSRPPPPFPGQCRARSLLRRLQPALRPSRRPGRLRLPLAYPAASISPAVSPCTIDGRRRQPLRHLGAHSIASAPLPGHAVTPEKPSNSPSPRWHAPRLSSRSAPARAISAARRTRRPAQLLTSRRNEKPMPASTTSPAAPLCGRYLIDRGDRISSQLIRHFLVATTGRGKNLAADFRGLTRITGPTEILGFNPRRSA